MRAQPAAPCGNLPSMTELSHAEDRYRDFVERSTVPMWCVELAEPIDLDLPAEKQLELCYRHALFVEANQAMAEAYRTPREEIIGLWRLDNILPRSLPTSEPFLLDVIRSRYRVADLVSRERTVDGRDLSFLNSFEGTEVDGKLVRVWGLSHDITELRRQQVELEELKERLEAENLYLQEELREGLHYDAIIGESEPWLHVISQIQLVAATESTVLLLGETGTGKELLARALHADSPRNSHPLIKVNCAALPSTLIESELFGHEKGAYSGADRQRQGRFELADQGTLFLDEVGELPIELQAKFLHLLQTGEFERLGSSTTRKADVRVIAATNRNLKHEVETGGFRSDLYYRLAVFPIEVPPLRDRRNDVPLLAMYFLTRLNAKHGKSIEAIPKDGMGRLVKYDWPGNVRELENLIERAVILARGNTLKLEGIGLKDSPALTETRSAASATTAHYSVSGPASAATRLQDVEREHILSVLEACGWTVKGNGNAAEQLGLKESTLRARMNKLGIRRPSTTPSL